jgi:amino acid transporter
LSDLELKAVTIVAIVLLTAVNIIGVKWGGLVQNITTWLKVGSLAAIAILPFVLGHANFELLSMPSIEPKTGSAVVGFGAGVLGVLWAYHGWMNLGPVAEELRDPQRNVPRSLFIGVGIVILTYLCANFAYALVLSQAEMADDHKVKVVAITFAQRLFESWGADYSALAGSAISAAIMVSVLGAANANVIIGSRTYFALGRDGLFPTTLGAVHAGFRTPVLALVLQAIWTSCLVVGIDLIQEKKASPFDTITDFVMFGAIIFETMTIVSIFAFRRKHPDWVRPYRCIGYPVTPIVYAIVLASVLANTIYDQPKKSAVGFGFILVGAGVYFARARFRSHEPAVSANNDSAGRAPPE